MVLTGLCLAGWMWAAWAVGRLPERRATALRLALAAVLVPLLGYVTWQYGPFAGLGGLAAGTTALLVHRLPARRG